MGLWDGTKIIAFCFYLHFTQGPNLVWQWGCKLVKCAKSFETKSICSSLFTVYGFQNNLGPTSNGVLTTSGANVSATVGGTELHLHILT